MRPTVRTRRIALVVGVTALGCSAAPAGAAIGGGTPITIDSFAVDQSALTLTVPPAGTTASSSVSGGGILGGERDLELALNGGVIAGSTTSATVSSGLLSFTRDTSIAGNVRLTWDGLDGSSTVDPSGLGGIDLTAGGRQNALDLAMTSADLPASVSVMVMTDPTHISTATVGLPGPVVTGRHVVIPFSSITPLFGAGADLTDVGAIHVTIGTHDAATSLVFDELTTDALLKAPMTVALTGDVNGDGLAEAGDELTYTTTIENPADAFGAASPGTTFTFDPPAGTTLVSGSVATSEGTVTSGNGVGDTMAAVAVGTISDGAATTVTAKLTIGTHPAGPLSAQATVGSSDLTALKTDDPGESGREDPTTIDVVESRGPEVPPVVPPTPAKPLPSETGTSTAPLPVASATARAEPLGPASAPVSTVKPKAVCASRRTLRVRLLRANRRATRATVTISGRKARRVPVRGGRVTVDLRGTPRAKYTVRIRVGQRTVTTRYYKTCRRPSESRG
ncbi:MAG: hypothetical protein WC558_01745 [Patulibacter sp.]